MGDSKRTRAIVRSGSSAQSGGPEAHHLAECSRIYVFGFKHVGIFRGFCNLVKIPLYFPRFALKVPISQTPRSRRW